MQHIPAADVGHVGLSSDQNFCAAEVAQFQYVRLIRGGGGCEKTKQNKTETKTKRKQVTKKTVTLCRGEKSDNENWQLARSNY